MEIWRLGSKQIYVKLSELNKLASSYIIIIVIIFFFPLEDISLDFSYPKIREKRKLSNVMLGLAIHLRKFQNVRYYIVIYAIYWPFSGGVIPDDKNNLQISK